MENRSMAGSGIPTHDIPTHETGPLLPARRALLATLAISALAAGCGGGGVDGLFSPGSDAPKTDDANVIGTGNVKVGLILPLSSAAGQAAAVSLKNAAAMAMADFGGGQAGIQLVVRDDKGTPEGARQAAQEVLAAGAELIIGPLFGASVQAAAGVAKAAGKPIIAFSSDAGAASRGVYLLSFLPQGDVSRVVSFAAGRGKKSFAALIPQSAYGNVAEAAFMQVANQAGRRSGPVARYQPGNPASMSTAVAQIKASLGQIDALFIAEGAGGIGALASALAAAGISSRQTQFLSTGIWSDPNVYRVAGLQGAWFAAPDNARFAALSGRYQSQFGAPPTRIASLAYDAVTLANALAQNFGSQRFTEATLTNSNGFSGQDGVFRFRQNGVNDRGLAVYEIGGGSARVISSAPTTFVGN